MTEFGPQEDLFPVEGRKLFRGDRVVVQTMWGDELGTVRAVYSHFRSWPLAEIEMDGGDTISIDPARVRHRECEDGCDCGGCVL